MLSCKDVAYLASDYLDKNLDGILPWKVRMHLVACRCCRRFIKHLQLTKELVPQIANTHLPEVDAEAVLKRIKERNQ